jgi:hypothetical protein
MNQALASCESTGSAAAPILSPTGLTWLLIAMCVIPIVTITALFSYLPKVYEGELKASVRAVGLPPGSFYAVRFSDRPPVPTGELIVKNESDQDWTHLNIQVNHFYQIYERNPIPAGEYRSFKLDRFVSRTGATFNLRYNPLRSVRIYARRPTKDRATYFCEYPWQDVPDPPRAAADPSSGHAAR